MGRSAKFAAGGRLAAFTDPCNEAVELDRAIEEECVVPGGGLSDFVDVGLLYSILCILRFDTCIEST